MVYRLLIQLVATALCLAVIGMFLLVRIKTGRFPRTMCGITVLGIHIVIYYTFVLLWELGIFSISAFMNNLLGTDLYWLGLWSSAIRLQTSIELVLMSVSIYRRQVWTQRVLQ